MKIFFMPMLPLTVNDYKQLGIEYFEREGYTVSILETHQMLLPGYKAKVDLDYYESENTYSPSTFQELIKIVEILSDTDYIFFYLASQQALELLEQIKSVSKVKFITYISGSVPSTTEPCGLLNRFKAFLRPLVMPFRMKNFESDIVFTGAPKDEKIFPFLCGKKTIKIPTHSRDYEICLHTDRYVNQKKYCVFLDTDVIAASDYVLFQKLNNDEQKNIESYYDKLITFFHYIQKSMNMEVIISAHPKSRIFKNKNEFRGFKVEHNQSASLVKGSDLVLTEGTTAVSFAVLFRKPLLFFTMNELAFFYNITCSYANQFKKKIFDVNNINNLSLESIQKDLKKYELYDSFKYKYLTYKDDSISVYQMIEHELVYGR